MKLEGSQVYPVPVAAVIAMLQDKAATVDKYEGMGHRDVEILDLTVDDDTIHIVSSRVVDVDLPGLREEGDQADEHDGPDRRVAWNGDGSWSGTFDVEVKGSPVHISGTMASLRRRRLASRRRDRLPGQDPDHRRQGRRHARQERRTSHVDAEFAFNDTRLRSRSPSGVTAVQQPVNSRNRAADTE